MSKAKFFVGQPILSQVSAKLQDKIFLPFIKLEPNSFVVFTSLRWTRYCLFRSSGHQTESVV